MWFCFLFLVAVVVLALFWSGHLPPPNARSLIRIRNGKCFVLKEALPHHVTSSVTEILRQEGVKKGFIAITPTGRVKFSHHIPKALHQRLRNVVLNP